MNALKAFFGGSKKATAVLVGVLGVLLRDLLGLPPEVVNQLVMLLMAYVGAQGIVDLGLALRGAKKD